MTLLQQIVTTLSFVFGIFTGEILASKIFGVPKRMLIQLLEIILFIVIVMVIFNFLLISGYAFYLTLAIYFVIAFLVIFFLRGTTTLLGRASLRLQKTKEKEREDNVVDLTRSLARRGYNESEIRRMLIESGFDKKKIDNILGSGLIETQARIDLRKRIKRRKIRKKKRIRKKRR